MAVPYSKLRRALRWLDTDAIGIKRTDLFVLGVIVDSVDWETWSRRLLARDLGIWCRLGTTAITASLDRLSRCAVVTISRRRQGFDVTVHAEMLLMLCEAARVAAKGEEPAPGEMPGKRESHNVGIPETAIRDSRFPGLHLSNAVLKGSLSPIAPQVDEQDAGRRRIATEIQQAEDVATKSGAFEDVNPFAVAREASKPRPPGAPDGWEFVAAWDRHARRIAPDRDAVLWLKGSPHMSKREQDRLSPILEHGIMTLPVLERWVACCKGKFGKKQTFTRAGFERCHEDIRQWLDDPEAIPFWVKGWKGAGVSYTDDKPAAGGQAPSAESLFTVDGQPVPSTIRPVNGGDIVHENGRYYEIYHMGGKQRRRTLMPGDPE